MFKALQRDVAPLRVPAHLRRLGVAIDLARLNAHAARRETIRAPVRIEPIDEAAGRRVPTFGRPQRQGVVDHPKLQLRDDVAESLCRGGLSFSHRVPSSLSNTGIRRLITPERRRAIKLNLRNSHDRSLRRP